MLELLAAALRRDLEERKLWHSLPHGSRSRACDLRKRRARGDGCGRGGVSRVHSSVTPLTPESLQCSGAGWGRGGRPVCARARLGDFQGPCRGAAATHTDPGLGRSRCHQALPVRH